MYSDSVTGLEDMSYSIVEFTDIKEITVIPSTDEGAARSRWPPNRYSTRLNNAVMMKEVACDGAKCYATRHFCASKYIILI